MLTKQSKSAIMKKNLLFFLFFLLISDIHSAEKQNPKGESTDVVPKTGDDLGEYFWNSY